MTLTDAQRKLLVEALRYREDLHGQCAQTNGPDTRSYHTNRASNARELAELIEGAESVTVALSRTQSWPESGRITEDS